jgi:hypothetical protein
MKVTCKILYQIKKEIYQLFQKKLKRIINKNNSHKKLKNKKAVTKNNLLEKNIMLEF